MLAERVVEWTREWEQAGIEKGMAKGLEQGREQGAKIASQAILENTLRTVVQHLEERFGPLPASALEHLQQIDSVERLFDLSFRVAEAGSLEALGLP